MTNERIIELAKQIESIMEELNKNGAIGGSIEGRNSEHEYIVSIHMGEEIPNVGEVNYSKFECGNTKKVERTVMVGKVRFFSLMDKSQAKKLAQQELFA